MTDEQRAAELVDAVATALTREKAIRVAIAAFAEVRSDALKGWPDPERSILIAVAKWIIRADASNNATTHHAELSDAVHELKLMLAKVEAERPATMTTEQALGMARLRKPNA